MAKPEDILTAVEQLEQALDGTSATRVEQALATLQQALRRRGAELKGHDDPLPDVDRPLLPSPGEDRKVGELHHQLESCLHEAEALRAEVRDSGTASESLRDRGHKLARALRNHEHAEVDLILETVTTDIGAGD